MGKRTKARVDFSTEDVRALLESHRCPLPFHAVRTRLLGTITSPAATVSPIEAVKELWGGELPKLERIEAVQELMDALMGLWNELAQHQQPTRPFHLVQVEVAGTREGLAQLALVRREELDGFLAGLFGQNAYLELPARTQDALKVLSDILGMLAGVHELASKPEKSTTDDDVGGLLHQIGELTKIADTEIHAAVVACAQERQSRGSG